MRPLLAVLLLLAAATPAIAAPAPALPPVERWQLASGMTVVHAPIAGSAVAAVQVWYRAGAVEDPAGKRGLARLFETLMFAGSTRLRPGDHRWHLERVGGTTSATVSEDAAVFADTLPAERFELALDLELDRMRGLAIGDDAVARAVELAQATQAERAGSTLWRLFRKAVATAYVQHPYGQAVAAPPAELAGLRAADARAFYDAYYQPGNALLVVAGGVEREALRAAVERRFGPLAKTAEPTRPAADLPEPPQSARRREEVADGDGLLVVAFHAPRATDDALYAYQLVGQILTGGRTSRLGKLVAARKALDVGGQVLARRDPGLLLLYAGVGRGGDVEALERAIDGELAKLGRGVSAAEVAKAKHQIEASVLDAAETAAGYADLLGVAWVLTGAPEALAGDLAELAAVTPAQVAAAARRLTPDRATVIVGRGQPEAR
jgi:zinc protease